MIRSAKLRFPSNINLLVKRATFRLLYFASGTSGRRTTLLRLGKVCLPSSLPSLAVGDTQKQGVPGDAVPWPEREVSSLPSLFFPLPRQAAHERYLSGGKKLAQRILVMNTRKGVASTAG